MKKFALAVRAPLAALGLCTALPVSAQLNILHAVDFDNPADPWASTGPVAITGTTLGTPSLQNTDVAPGAGNTYSASFDGSQSRYGTDFSGINTATTGYGVELWVKNPGSNYPSYFWLNIASFGYPGDSAFPEQENGVAVGIYEGEYWGVSNSGLTGFRSTIPTGGAGSINGWDHLAFVAEGTTGSFYRNGVLVGSRSTFAFAAPGANWHLFSGQDGYPAYTGLADSLKFFTFASGTFQASSLDYAAAAPIPESSAFGIALGTGTLALAASHRRSRDRR